MSGAFVAVTGPSGAGKDTVIAYARERLAGQPGFVFPRRIVTRPADPDSEDHDSLTPEAFAAADAAGAFAFSWSAHGLSYGLPQTVDADIGAGRIVVANVSRTVVPAIAARYGTLVLAVISAHPDIIAARLAARGREDAAAIAKRLGRMQVEEALRSEAVLIENSGPVELAGERFLNVLRDVAKHSG
jgi:ribose 1,5-bisphosphokinase